MKKILYYNWVPFDDDEKRGGGVTVYQKNLIEKLQERDDYEVFFLCSGLSFNLRKDHVFIEEYSNCFGKGCRSFRIVNSPVLSPAFCNFKNIKSYLVDQKLLEILITFIEENGPFDVIHYNNFEGLSLRVFDLKKYYPNTKFIYSLHNYYSFCPQVNLWKNEAENCKDNHDGKDCVNCVINNFTVDDVIKADILAYYLKKFGFYSKSGIFKNVFKAGRFLAKVKYKLTKKTTEKVKIDNEIWKNLSIDDKNFLENASMYKNFSVKSIDAINRNIDVVLAVSDRVREIAIRHGILPRKIITNYIGTKFADKQLGCSAYPYTADTFNIIYMGYARRDKGFFFLLDSLEKLPGVIASKINIYFSVKTDDVYIINRMKSLREKFAGVYFKNGYKHSELKSMLMHMQLGIIPVLWEDNLPQVAIELNAEGIPVLCSDLGGAHELSSSRYFIFKGNSEEDFIRKLVYLVDNREIIKDYWNKRKRLKTMDEHIQELDSIYERN